MPSVSFSQRFRFFFNQFVFSLYRFLPSLPRDQNGSHLIRRLKKKILFFLHFHLVSFLNVLIVSFYRVLPGFTEFTELSKRFQPHLSIEKKNFF